MMPVYAFPRPLPTVAMPPDEAYEALLAHSGMTLRDYFAAQAMVGYLTTSDEPTAREAALHADKCAEWAYIQADAMLKAREK